MGFKAVAPPNKSLKLFLMQEVFMFRKIFFISISILLLLAAASCAPKHVKMPSFPDADINKHLAELANVSALDAVLSLEYEKGNTLMNGDASLTISENHIDLKVYYLGFLAGYIKENKGVITASQKMDKNKSFLLVEGLKNSLLWWQIKDYSIEHNSDFYKLENYNRKIFLDRKTLLPSQQIIELYNGDELRISYDTPARVEEGKETSGFSHLASWYQSDMRITLNNHLLKIKIKSYSFRQE